MIRSRYLTNDIKERGSVASAACRRSPKCLIGVKLERGLGAAGRAFLRELYHIDT
jgi:hypothetical protein